MKESAIIVGFKSRKIMALFSKNSAPLSTNTICHPKLVSGSHLTKDKKCFVSTAFTLIELLVVIVIVGILATVSVAQFNQYVKQAKLTKVIATEKQFQRKLLADCVVNGYENCEQGTSCADILANNPEASDDYYMIKAGNNSPLVGVYCDMTGGGWTRVRALIENEAERLAWADADPNIDVNEDGGCVECQNIWPKNIQYSSDTVSSYRYFYLGSDFVYTDTREGKLSECIKGKTLWAWYVTYSPHKPQIRSESDICYNALQDYIYYK